MSSPSFSALRNMQQWPNWDQPHSDPAHPSRPIAPACYICKVPCSNLGNLTQHLQGKGHKAEVRRNGLSPDTAWVAGVSMQAYLANGEQVAQHQEDQKRRHQGRSEERMRNLQPPPLPKRFKKGDAFVPAHCPLCNCPLQAPIPTVAHLESVKHVRRMPAATPEQLLQLRSIVDMVSDLPGAGAITETIYAELQRKGVPLDSAPVPILTAPTMAPQQAPFFQPDIITPNYFQNGNAPSLNRMNSAPAPAPAAIVPPQRMPQSQMQLFGKSLVAPSSSSSGESSSQDRLHALDAMMWNFVKNRVTAGAPQLAQFAVLQQKTSTILDTLSRNQGSASPVRAGELSFKMMGTVALGMVTAADTSVESLLGMPNALTENNVQQFVVEFSHIALQNRLIVRQLTATELEVKDMDHPHNSPQMSLMIRMTSSALPREGESHPNNPSLLEGIERNQFLMNFTVWAVDELVKKVPFTASFIKMMRYLRSSRFGMLDNIDDSMLVCIVFQVVMAFFRAEPFANRTPTLAELFVGFYQYISSGALLPTASWRPVVPFAPEKDLFAAFPLDLKFQLMNFASKIVQMAQSDQLKMLLQESMQAPRG